MPLICIGTSLCVAAAISTGTASLRGLFAALSVFSPKKCHTNNKIRIRPSRLTACTMRDLVLFFVCALGLLVSARASLRASSIGPDGISSETFSFMEDLLFDQSYKINRGGRCKAARGWHVSQ